MKRIKTVNGYAIYQATTQRDADNYNCEVGCYNLYLSSDIRDYGLSCSYPEYDNIDSLAAALELANGSSYAVACALAEELSDSTIQDMDLVLEIERRLDAGACPDDIRNSYSVFGQCFNDVLSDEDPDLGDELADCPEQEPVAVSDENATCVYLRDLYAIAPQAHFVIVTRDEVTLRVTTRREYTGGKADGDLIVWRVTPASYPMYKNVLEVEII